MIDRAQIERAQGQTLVQLLAQQPGLQLAGNGGAGKTSSIFIRWLEARHTLLLLDGVPVSSATVGTPSLDNLPLELIERIETVRGPMTSLYGNGAMGGVVQLFTRRAVQGFGASAKAALGTQHQAQGAAGVSRGDGRFDAIAELRNRVQRLALDGRIADGWTGTPSWADSVDAYETVRSASAFTTPGSVQTRQRRLSLEQRVDTPAGQAFGLLERTRQTVSRPGTPLTVSERDIDALALGLTGTAAGHTWQASARHDRNSQLGRVNTGALGWGWGFMPGWRVLASAGTSHTLPSFNQLYFPSFGNPALLPEKGRHAEAGLQWTGAGQQLRATWYGHRCRGFITAGPQPQNLPKAEMDGFTLARDGQWNRLALEASLDHTDPRNAIVGNANFDKLLPRRARNAARLGAQWPRGPWAAGARVQAFSHRCDDAANRTRLGGCATLGFDLRWRLQPGLTLALMLDNVADKRNETALGCDQPGRSAQLALRVAVLAPPHISNLDEFQPLLRVPGLHLRWAREPAALEGADGVVLPGSKQVSGDLAWLRAQGLDAAIAAHAARGGRVLGVCGGLQMLGRTLADPEGHDGERFEHAPGLGLLALHTRFGPHKRLLASPVRFGDTAAPWAALACVAAAGYEIRCGHTPADGAAPVLFDAQGLAIGWQHGSVLGVYAHGLFESPAVLRALFGAAVPTLDDAFERIADGAEAHLDPALLAHWLGA